MTARGKNVCAVCKTVLAILLACTAARCVFFFLASGKNAFAQIEPLVPGVLTGGFELTSVVLIFTKRIFFFVWAVVWFCHLAALFTVQFLGRKIGALPVRIVFSAIFLANLPADAMICLWLHAGNTASVFISLGSAAAAAACVILLLVFDRNVRKPAQSAPPSGRGECAGGRS